MQRRNVVKANSRPQGWCNHRSRPPTLVFTEMGCHARCPNCGAIGIGCPNSEEAQRALLIPVGSENSRYA
jgi:hypothetical protein